MPIKHTFSALIYMNLQGYPISNEHVKYRSDSSYQGAIMGSALEDAVIGIASRATSTSGSLWM
ncbi:hypothetical protein RBB77_01705 [Tunturibacter psychrotolerans]|uniref:Uncharacterized protein n=1 Tax=Tunturiibacter psychrotolerans TaxID=3069686 RepID=A0AAU7ZRJ6_9BACT